MYIISEETMLGSDAGQSVWCKLIFPAWDSGVTELCVHMASIYECFYHVYLSPFAFHICNCYYYSTRLIMHCWSVNTGHNMPLGSLTWLTSFILEIWRIENEAIWPLQICLEIWTMSYNWYLGCCISQNCGNLLKPSFEFRTI